MAVADVYDALVSKRVYKPPMPHDEAVEIIAKGRGSQFDPDVVDAFLEIAPLFSNIARTFADYEEERRMLEGADDTAGRAGAGVLRRVLLVDDNAINREIMFSQLTSDGYLVQVAENGRAALALYRERRLRSRPDRHRDARDGRLRAGGGDPAPGGGDADIWRRSSPSPRASSTSARRRPGRTASPATC